ncbi:C-X-C motif chemokine 11, partial [Ophiophagus hannah]
VKNISSLSGSQAGQETQRRDDQTSFLYSPCPSGLLCGSHTRRERCLCKRSGMLSVNMERVTKVEYHRSTSSCGQEELLVMFRNRRKRCLNLNGDQGKIIKQRYR